MSVDMKQYIISFQATLQGHKMVLTQLKGMEKQIKGVGKVTAATAKKTSNYNDQITKLVKRAVMVIPVWLLMRAVFMTVLRTFGDMVKAQLDLEEGLARIRTVMQGTAQVIDAEMIAIKRQILDASIKSRMSIKELAEAFYFLKTASLTAAEATSAFSATTDAMIGTGAKAKEMARAIAGIYNTMGKYILEGATAQEKFRKIADVLTYTYATQDVEMSELIAGYTKLAPYVSGLSDSFTDLVTMIGFLNTRMLRAGRTGRLTARTILQITKNADKLREIFGIVFDPDKPINLIGVITQINEKLKTTGKLSFKWQKALQMVFQTRGQITPRLLLESFDGLAKSIKLAGENVDGFAQKMQQIRMATVTAQAAKMKNIFAVLMNDFLSGVYSAKDFADTLKLLNETFISMRTPIQRTGQLIGWLATNFSQLILLMEQIGKFEFEASIWERLVPGAAVFRNIGKIAENIKAMELKPVSWREYLVQQEKIAEVAKKEGQFREQIKTTEGEIKELRIGTLKEEQVRLKHNAALMKIMGASALDISKYRLESLESVRHLLMDEDYELELMKRQNSVLQEQAKHRQQITDVFLKAEISLLKAVGASEIQILEAREKQIRVQAKSKGIEWERLELLNLRIQQQQVLLKEKAREMDVARSLALSYEKADMFQKGRIRRAIELTQLEEGELVGRFRRDAYDKQVILEYWSSFGKSAQDAITEAIWEMGKLPGKIPKLEAGDLLPEGEIVRYAQKYREQMFKAVDDINARFQAGMPTFSVPTKIPAQTGLPAPAPRTPSFRELEGRTFGAETLVKLERLIETYREEQEKTREELREIQQKNEDTKNQIKQSIGY